MDLEKFNVLSKTLMQKNRYPSLQMDILMSKIRISFTTENMEFLILNIDAAKEIFETTYGWDRKTDLSYV